MFVLDLSHFSIQPEVFLSSNPSIFLNGDPMKTNKQSVDNVVIGTLRNSCRLHIKLPRGHEACNACKMPLAVESAEANAALDRAPHLIIVDVELVEVDALGDQLAVGAGGGDAAVSHDQHQVGARQELHLVRHQHPRRLAKQAAYAPAAAERKSIKSHV